MQANQRQRMSTETMVLGAILTALVVVLQLLGSFVKLGMFSISLVLIPIVIGASVGGAKLGAWLGGVFGIVVLISGDAAPFMAISIPGTIITVMVKGIACGLVAFCISTCGGLITAKIMNKLTGGKINPLIGSAGVSAVPMAARVAQTVGQKEDPSNFLLMHAMGPNVAGVIGSAVAAGVFLSWFR